jgi:PST family polysaccharide transporter
MSEKEAYKGIFKSTFLFGFVQVFNIFAKVGLNKVVAILLGPEGLGLIGLFQSTINILKTALGFGVSQSAVRDISEANGEKDLSRFSIVISVTKKIVWYTASLGAIITVIFSRYLSIITFGTEDYTIGFVWLSIVVFFSVLSDGYLSILKGLRQLRYLAKASLLGSIVGVVSAIPFYYIYGIEGVIPSLIISIASIAFFAWFYQRKIIYTKVSVTLSLCVKEGKGMVKMGMAIMYVSLLGFISDYIIRSYVASNSSIEMVGFFQAGSTIITGYFGILITAMSIDYYPRLSAINKDNIKLTEELNKQCEVGLIIMAPLVVFFIFLMPFFIRVLYSEEFLISLDYINYAIFGILITICSNAMGMILLAKQKSNVFVYSVTFSRAVMIVLEVIGFKFYGLKGLGIATIIFGILHFF